MRCVGLTIFPWIFAEFCTISKPYSLCTVVSWLCSIMASNLPTGRQISYALARLTGRDDSGNNQAGMAPS
jgi:hypothetical protein